MELEFLRPLIKHLPEVDIPKRKVPFKEKLYWTGIILLLFFIMGVIYPYQVSPELLAEKISGFDTMTMIFASSIGSIISVGIGPIVTSSIILQLLSGADMIKIDLHTKEGKALFQGTQKILTVVLAFFEAGALVYFTGMVSGTGLIAFTVFQIALGSILLMFMDEVVSKWGIGSGISLFIAGGVSQTIITGSINPMREAGLFVGAIPSFIQTMMAGSMNFAIIFPLIGTILIFLVTAFCESMRLEIPLSYGGVRGIGGRFPLKFFYVSNIPVILAAALLANIRMWTGLVGVDISNPPADMSMIQNIVFQIGRHITVGE
ncbi:MAG TPA: hypothetical protein ENN13_00475, partial [Candidatus Altiarchaeales archaeon]|nr:hypothetical protein [Candidatus Altiarchaeales archaeon]